MTGPSCRALALGCLLAAGGCSSERTRDRADIKEAPPPVLVGVDPKDFDCASLISPEALGELVGGRARAVTAAAPTPIGVPSPCTYLVAMSAEATSAISWTFDLDCRDGMQARAEALFAHYERTNAAPAAERGKAAAAGATEVAVGARALDHSGHGLLFIDDDAPCYVRVVGPDAAARLALATHLVRALTPATAPMSRRAASTSAPASR